jgi:hypothetical protein
MRPGTHDPAERGRPLSQWFCFVMMVKNSGALAALVLSWIEQAEAA